MVFCDIIIPIYNNLADTQNCLDWLARHTEEGYRLILADDGSGPETARWLEQAARDQSFGPTLLVRNQRNQGWCVATNRGLEASTAPFLCLLNNDTLPAPGWLPALREKLERVPGLGLVQPLGNERLVRKEAQKDIVGYARQLTLRNAGQYKRLSYISGFCTLLPRRLYETLGPFDPVYPQGLWADHDYLRRAQRQGWFAGEAQDALVYHLESRTLGVVEERLEGKAREGEKIFISRWGYKHKLFWLPPWPLSDAGPQVAADLTALYQLADQGHAIYVPLLHGEGVQDILRVHGLAEHSNVFFLPCPLPPRLARLWARGKYRYLVHKKRVNELVRGPMAAHQLGGPAPADVPAELLGTVFRGK